MKIYFFLLDAYTPLSKTIRKFLFKKKFKMIPQISTGIETHNVLLSTFYGLHTNKLLPNGRT